MRLTLQNSFSKLVLLNERTSTVLGSEKFRYAFNGKENDDDVKGDGNYQDYGMRAFDSRLGKFLSVDPLTKNYPELTPYQFASNTPIWAIDIDGLEAYFTTDGKFDRWGEKKGKDAPVIIISTSGDVNGITLKNNANDFKGKDITVQQFLMRSQRVWAEGGRTKTTAKAYAHAQDNIRENAGGNESDNYENMSTKNFDKNSKFPSYREWNSARGEGYDNLEGLNKLEDANMAIASVSDLLQGKSTDPTSGATQWRGGKNAMNLLEKYNGKEVPLDVLGVKTKGYRIINLTTITTDSGYHSFFNMSNVSEKNAAQPPVPSKVRREILNPKQLNSKPQKK